MTRPLDSNDGGLFLHDPLAMALAVDATLVRTRPLPVRVETKGEHTRGMSVSDRRRSAGARPGDGNAAAGDSSLVDVAFEVDAARVLGLVAERVLGAARPAERPADVVVVGSANTDLTVTAHALPRPGETVTEAVHAAALAVTRSGAQSGIPRRSELARTSPARVRALQPR